MKLSQRLNSSSRLHESMLKRLMVILDKNPYGKFFKELRDIPNLYDHKPLLNSNLVLDQYLLLPSGLR